MKKFLPASGQINFLLLGLGRHSLVWVWKFSPKNINFFHFYPSGQKDLFGFGQKVPGQSRGTKPGQPLLYCGSKVCSSQVKAHFYFISFNSKVNPQLSTFWATLPCLPPGSSIRAWVTGQPLRFNIHRCQCTFHSQSYFHVAKAPHEWHSYSPIPTTKDLTPIDAYLINTILELLSSF